MSIKIVTDSTCDLPPAAIEKYGIHVVPLHIHFQDGHFLDGVDLTREEFYDKLVRAEEFPTTATPGMDGFKSTYRMLIKEGAQEILSIHVSEALSATVNVARKAAEEIDFPITVLDSGQLSLGVGFLVVKAAQLAAAGKRIQDILQAVQEAGKRTYVLAALDTLEYLRKSGRMNRFVAGIGSLLHVKPILKMNQGNPTSELIRTHKRSLQRLVDYLLEFGPLQELALVHTNAPAEVEIFWEQIKSLFPDREHPLSVNVTPVIGSHIGPGAVGFACQTKP